MAGLKDILFRVLGGRSPEDFIREIKEKLHDTLNQIKDNPESRGQLRDALQKTSAPLKYFNAFTVRPHLADNDKLRDLAEKYQMNKIELKRVFKLAIEFEEKIELYLKDESQFDETVVTLRKVLNALDEQLIVELVNALDQNIDYGKIEKAYLTYQESLAKAYNVDGLSRDINDIMGGLMNNFRNAFSGVGASKPKAKASDKRPEVRMLEPALQNSYDHYREEGYNHDEAMQLVQEKKDVEGLPEQYLEAYRVFRQEGRTHQDAMEYTRSLADKAATTEEGA